MKRFQFTVRELLLIIAIIAVIAGWWIDHQRITNSLANQKWEFKTVDYPELKGAGAEGWEISSSYATASSRSPMVILKRRIP